MCFPVAAKMTLQSAGSNGNSLPCRWFSGHGLPPIGFVTSPGSAAQRRSHHRVQSLTAGYVLHDVSAGQNKNPRTVSSDHSAPAKLAILRRVPRIPDRGGSREADQDGARVNSGTPEQHEDTKRYRLVTFCHPSSERTTPFTSPRLSFPIFQDEAGAICYRRFQAAESGATSR